MSHLFAAPCRHMSSVTLDNSIIRRSARILLDESMPGTPRACAPCKSKFIHRLTKAILHPYKWPAHSSESGERNTHSPHPSRCFHLRSLPAPHVEPRTTAGGSRPLSSRCTPRATTLPQLVPHPPDRGMPAGSPFAHGALRPMRRRLSHFRSPEVSCRSCAASAAGWGVGVGQTG